MSARCTYRRSLLASGTSICVALSMAFVVIAATAIAQTDAPAEKISDSAIEMAIYNEMRHDDAVAAHWIDVESINGVVTLSGRVDNLLARERARDITMAVRGVRSVANAVEVMPTKRTSDEIRSDVEMALLTDPATDSYEVDVVSAQKGKVELRGQVNSWAEEQLCLEVAKGVRGVREVVDEISIDFQSERDDAEIRMDVLGRLSNDVRVDDGMIDVEVEDGNVKLSGAVGSAAERQRARSNAWVLGAKSVDASNLDVRWWLRDEMQRTKQQRQDVDDETIRKSIKMAYLYDPRVLSFKPQVEVDNGVVTLSGRVSNLKAKHAAAETARNTYGVWRVKNYLLVRPAESVDDRQIERKIRDALKRNPYTDGHEVSVTATNGAVTLRGAVDTAFEKHQVLDVVTRVKGVIDYNDFLHVSQNWSYKADWAIEDDIESELWWSPYVDRDQVNVDVEDGVATLTGTVDDWGEWIAAEDNAFDGGAWKVRNKLEVRHWPPVAMN